MLRSQHGARGSLTGFERSGAAGSTRSPTTRRFAWSARSTTALSVLAVSAALPPIVAVLSAAPGPVLGELTTVLPDLGASFVRMLLAYLLSLGVALVYGYFAATSSSRERVLIPILDLLQSIPILGFFPFAIGILVALTPGSSIGANVASIFLIFTSMTWNMIFGVYESLKSIPEDLREATESFGVHGWRRIRHVLLPATANRLVYNSVLSWTGGWYFLVASEFLSTAGSTTALPGIGTFLLVAAGRGDGLALVTGLAALVVLIALLDLAVWRPLGHWAERYRYDVSPSGTADLSGHVRSRAPLLRAASLVRRGVVTGVSRIRTPFLALATRARPTPVPRERPWARAAVRWSVLGALLVLGWLLVIAITVGTFHILSGPIAPMVRGQIDSLPIALALSGGRLVAAYAVSLAIALPLALAFARRPTAARLGLPVVEVIASVPATALFPVLIFAVWPVIGAEATSVLMLITGMVWYLFFNLLSGVRALPPDLDEAARSYGLRGALYRRRLLLPAIFPAFVTGSVTALGGGWNALVIAEYLQNPSGHLPFQVLGIGGLIDLGNSERFGLPLMVAALFTMVIAVLVVNEVLWKPLYRKAVGKYRFD